MTPKFGENWLMRCIVVFSFRGASPPDPLTRGSAPGSRWGHSPQTPIIGSRYANALMQFKKNENYSFYICDLFLLATELRYLGMLNSRNC